MTRPPKQKKGATLPKLRRVAYRLHGEGAIVGVERKPEYPHWWLAWVSFEDGETVECVAPTRNQAKQMLMQCLRAVVLPSAAPKRKKAGRRG